MRDDLQGPLAHVLINSSGESVSLVDQFKGIPVVWMSDHMLIHRGEIMEDSNLDPMVHHPSHYTSHPSGVEVIEITRYMLYPDLANAFKYVARHLFKGNPTQDLEKALFYVNDQLEETRPGHVTGLTVVVSVASAYIPAFVPFYKYIDAEPVFSVAQILTKIWNADKMEVGNEQSELLHRISYEIERMIKNSHFDLHAAKYAPAGISIPEPTESESEPPKPDPTVDTFEMTARWAGKNRMKLLGAQLLVVTGDGAAQQWETVEEIRVQRGGIVFIKTSETQEEFRMKPNDTITMRKASVDHG